MYDIARFSDVLVDLDYRVNRHLYNAMSDKREIEILEAAANLAETLAQELRDAADKIRNKPQGINPADISY